MGMGFLHLIFPSVAELFFVGIVANRWDCGEGEMERSLQMVDGFVYDNSTKGPWLLTIGIQFNRFVIFGGDI